MTGGGSGIGAGLCRKWASLGARVFVSDRDLSLAESVAREVGGEAVRCDVGVAEQVHALVKTVEERAGRVDVFFSNAGLHLGGTGADGADRHSREEWERVWRVNVLSHVEAFRALLPLFRRQKKGRFVVTASAAGLLSQVGDASYSASKHAAVGLAEALAIAHGDEGVAVHCVCPQAVDTAMGRAGKGKEGDAKNPAAGDGVLSVDEVAESVARGIEEGRFLILPHARVAEYVARKAADHDRWIAGMRRWRRSLL